MRSTIIDPRLIAHLRHVAINEATVYRVPLVANALGEKLPDSASREVMFSNIKGYLAHDDSDKGAMQEVRQTENIYKRSIYRFLMDGAYPTIDIVMEFGGVRYQCEVVVDGKEFHLIGAYTPASMITELVLEEVKTRV